MSFRVGYGFRKKSITKDTVSNMTNGEANKIIRSRFRIRRRDTLPFSNHGYKSTRRGFAKLLNALGYKIGAEIGVASGRYSEMLFNKIKNLKLICVDPWKAFDGLHPTPQRRIDQGYRRFLLRVKDRDVEIMQMKSVEASMQIPDHSLDFVYIDAVSDFDNVMRDLIAWNPKVRPGGVVSGRNYHKFPGNGAIAAVNVYTRAHRINEWYVTSHRGSDPYPTWFWVKEEDA